MRQVPPAKRSPVCYSAPLVLGRMDYIMITALLLKLAVAIGFGMIILALL